MNANPDTPAEWGYQKAIVSYGSQTDAGPGQRQEHAKILGLVELWLVVQSELVPRGRTTPGAEEEERHENAGTPVDLIAIPAARVPTAAAEALEAVVVGFAVAVVAVEPGVVVGDSADGRPAPKAHMQKYVPEDKHQNQDHDSFA